MRLKQKSSNSRQSAFTLIEIMVAAAITIIMIGLVVQITSEVLKIWNRSAGKLSANAEARIAMELLTSDLETAVLVNNDQQWMRVESEFEVGSPLVGNTVSLKLFAPALDRPEQPGNISAIAYRLAYARAYPGANVNSFVLFRALEGPEETFNSLLGPSADDPQLDLLTPDFWTAGSIEEAENYLAGNIVDFKIYIYGENDAGEEIILNAGEEDEDEEVTYAKNDQDFDGELNLDYIYGGVDSSDEVPTSAEIFLTVVSDEGMEILANLQAGRGGTGFEDTQAGRSDVIRQHGEVFKRRVHFQAKPL